MKLCSPALVWTLTVLLIAAGPAGAATLVVDRTDDVLAGACTAAPNDCSLRGAIITSNTSAVTDTIELQPGATYKLTLGPADSGPGIHVATSGDLDITSAVMINGHRATVIPNNVDRAFDIGNETSSFSVIINDLSIAGGKPAGLLSFGGAINVRGAALTLNNCSIIGATTQEGSAYDNGGAIAVNSLFTPPLAASLMLKNCTIGANQGGNGGGIVVGGKATAVIQNSTIYNNQSHSGQGGGGIFVAGTQASVQVINSSLNGNSTLQKGGGIFVYTGPVMVRSSTISGNTGNSAAETNGGGGIGNAGGNVQVGNSIIAGNTHNQQGPNLLGPFISNGFNLIGAYDGSTGFSNGVLHDQVGTAASPLDAKLGPLQDNGGLTDTMGLLAGSPALDHGYTTLTTDQRGQPRPYDNPALTNATGSNGSDIGAVEVQPPDTTAPTVTITQPVVNGLYKSLALASGNALDDSSGIAQVTGRLFRHATNGNTAGYWAGGNIFTATYSAANEILCNGGRNWTLVLPALSAGDYDFRATATDRANHSAVSTTNLFTIETTPPQVNVTQPVNNGIYQSVGTATGTASDASGIAYVTGRLYRYATGAIPAGYWAGGAVFTPGYSAANEIPCTGTTSWSLNLPALADGNYYFAATATDSAGNTATSGLNKFAIDTAAPAVQVTAPTQNSSYASLATATGTASDNIAVTQVTGRLYRYANSGLGISAGYWAGGSTFTAGYSAANEIVCSGTTSWSLTLPSLTVGNYYFAATASDAAGNTAFSGLVKFSITGGGVAPLTPRSQPAAVTFSGGSARGNLVQLNFSGALDSQNSGAAFSVSGYTVSAVDIAGNVVTLHLIDNVPSGAGVTATWRGVTDAAGGAVADGKWQGAAQ